MPNWCDNSLTVRHADKTKLDELESELSKDENAQLLQHFRPYEGEWDYGWCVENWGTKWDAHVYGWERTSDETMFISFETAWSPPITLYEYIEQDGWEVEGLYNEPGMCFTGIYEDGADSYYEYSDLSADEIEENLPTILEDTFGIAQYKRDWESEQEEEEWDGSTEEPSKFTEQEMEQALTELKEEFDRLNGKNE
jgi:hypothetical protein